MHKVINEHMVHDLLQNELFYLHCEVLKSLPYGHKCGFQSGLWSLVHKVMGSNLSMMCDLQVHGFQSMPQFLVYKVNEFQQEKLCLVIKAMGFNLGHDIWFTRS